jgi:hypothetical protein
MSRRTAARVAWSLCAACAALIALALLLNFLTTSLHSMFLRVYLEKFEPRGTAKRVGD